MSFKNFKYQYIQGADQTIHTELLRQYGISELDIEDVFTDTQLSKVEVKEKYTYVALQFPEYNKQQKFFFIKKIHCFIKNDLFLLINENEYKYANEFNEEIKPKIEKTDLNCSSYYVFYELLDFCITKTIKAIKKFRIEIKTLEKDVFEDKKMSDIIEDIQIIKRNLINFKSIILPIKDNICELMTKTNSLIDKQGVEKLDDSLDKIKKILNNLSNFQEQMNVITETHEALIARNTNHIIKFLTSLNIIFLIPTLIASFFGMNVNFGWDVDNFNPFNLFLIFFVMVTLTIFSFLFFKKKNWL
jgi:magnesium transporter